ncbi:MAG: AmmeMemoRadiSam system protein A [Acidobacteriota bacterium]
MPPLTEEERKTLLVLARQALQEGVQGPTAPRGIPDPTAALMEPRGAFVTLRKHGQLRGCIGHVQTKEPLYKTVQECAVASALTDPRFTPVTPDEVPNLHIEISVLTQPAEIAPEQIVIGEHGLIISQGRRRGLLLPQVPVTWKWDREKFLEETCVKAGLPEDAWRRGARIEAFTAEVFEEPTEPSASSPSPGSTSHFSTN